MNAIIVEDRLEELFDTLPVISIGGTSYSTVFKYGDQKELIAFLSSTKGDDVKPYPLIWYVYPNEEADDGNNGEVALTLSLVIAVNNRKTSMLNNERKETTYATILEPLRNNVRIALKRANIVNLLITDGIKFTTSKFPNYSGDDNNTEASELTDVWDAIKQVQNVIINNDCLRTILY
jgi:hypothetical protein